MDGVAGTMLALSATPCVPREIPAHVTSLSPLSRVVPKP